MRIDLHVHSAVSDGTDTPTEVVAAALATGLDVLALTDHDTTGGWDEAAGAAARTGRPLQLVRGAELSCVTPGPAGTPPISLHLLAYLFDPAEPELRERRSLLRDGRVGRGRAIVDRLAAAGTGVTWEQVRRISGDGVVGRPHIAAALVERGHVASVSDAFSDQWLGTASPFYVDKPELDATEAVRLVRAAGGVPVVAHPFAALRGRIVDDDTVRALAAAGLAGLECDHPDHDAAARKRTRRLAAELGLFTTGSSDYHGSRKVQGLGACTTTPEAYAALLDQVDPARGGLPVLRFGG
ncbi:MAG: 3,5-nucleoside bisphosphate phosphatase [Mycobacterium sp.]|nr:3,5-nucleoside bisphosphate phosphatase [Mycobacterium sp.]